MKQLSIITVAFVAVLSSGCATSQLAKLAGQLKNDNATFVANVTTIYGTFRLVRTNPGTNTPPLIASPDGTVEIKGR